MSKTRFTRPPWRLDTENGFRAVEGRCFTGEYKLICPRVLGGNPEESKANAHLIKAAPNMYAALEAIIDELLGGDETSATQIARHAGRLSLSEARGDGQP